MANSSRAAAPRSAVAGSAAFPTQSAHRALMSLSDVRDAIENANNSLIALCELLDAANGARLSADHLHVLLAPVQQQLGRAFDDLNDMHLVEPTTDTLPVLDTAEPAPVQAVRPLASGEVLLRAPGKVTGRFFTINGDEALVMSDDNDFEIRLYRDYSNKNKRQKWNPAWWFSFESRQDMQGRNWSGNSSTYITDDFGNLVEIGGAA
ncbi:DUF1484 family protein [Polaromonas naphthalenivorans]|uniref:Uncharacterized protein n=1 Tax=Polaromonas naphthalenivorans (strain CJ2) TaxID=365044 RepID=A1VSJ4_POLNA|nr:DUF1484 family protein [Polaromonas naphthalenivorans]ABM38622.1 hypothetical protein Pnap_3325 [Polaromonas naphthalenivorans CJ2]